MKVDAWWPNLATLGFICRPKTLKLREVLKYLLGKVFIRTGGCKHDAEKLSNSDEITITTYKKKSRLGGGGMGARTSIATMGGDDD